MEPGLLHKGGISLEKRGKPPYFEKMYPEASREVITCLKKSQRKIQHMEYDIKVPRTYVSRRTGKTVTLPPLEVSMEFYLDAGFDFPDERVDIENDYINKIVRKSLYEALDRLSGEDLYLIVQLFFKGRSEQALAKELHVYQNAVHKRKKRILRDLKKAMNGEVVKTKND